MISIVAHGILGPSYRQDVVVDEGVRDKGNLDVLYDIRRLLSTQYGDDTPISSWALQPAPSGMWISRVERAFDADYAPAYIAISFLIPCELRPSDLLLKFITTTLIRNHARYIQQNIIQNSVDWSFLTDLATHLDSHLSHSVSRNHFFLSPQYEVAYSSEDIFSILPNLWDSRIARCRILFFDKRIISEDKEAK